MTILIYLFDDLLGRVPTQAELQKYSSQLEQGTNEKEIRNEIARSEEAKRNIENLLVRYTGGVHPQALQFWQHSLVQTQSINEVAQMIHQWSL